MKKDGKKILDLLEKSTNVAICFPHLDNEDLVSTAIIAYKLVKELGKEADLLIAKEPSEEIVDSLNNHKVSFRTEVKPLSYVISIDYGKSGIDKITWDTDEENNKVNCFIVPTSGSFDFDSISYSTQGSNYDLTLLFDASSLDNMGEIYEKSDYLFKENDVISITKSDIEVGDENYLVDADSSYLLAFYNIAKDRLMNGVSELIAQFTVARGQLLEGGSSAEVFRALGELAKSGVDVDKIFREQYFAKSYSNLDLQIKLMHNVKVDRDARVVWSVVPLSDMKFAGVTEETLDTRGRIPFNVSADFDIAFAAYEVSSDKLKIIVESNVKDKYSAAKIAGVYGGEGNEAQATALIENLPAKEFEKKFFVVLKDLYSVNVKGAGASSSLGK